MAPSHVASYRAVTSGAITLDHRLLNFTKHGECSVLNILVRLGPNLSSDDSLRNSALGKGAFATAVLLAYYRNCSGQHLSFDLDVALMSALAPPLIWPTVQRNR